MSDPARGRLGLLAVAYLAFVGLGLPDALPGVAWPSLRDAFGFGPGGLGLILAVAAAGYALSSSLFGSLRRVPLGVLLAGSSLLVAVALLVQAGTGAMAVFLAAAALVGMGGGAIDAAMNLFVARAFGPRHLNWLHASYGAGATLGPLVMTAAVAGGWCFRAGLVAVAVPLAGLALLYAATRRAWAVEGAADEHEAGRPATTLRQAIARPGVRLGALTFAFVAGTEAVVGAWSFTVLTEARGAPAVTAGFWVAAYWAAFTAGRVVAGFVVERVGAVRLTRCAALLVVLGAAGFALAPILAASVALAGLVLTGLGLAPLYPGLMAETPRRLGADAVQAIGLQVGAAVLGAALLPALAGLVAARLGPAAVGYAPLAAALLLLALHERLMATLDRA